MKRRYAIAHMKAAYIYASLSHCKRKQVGCIIVKDDRIISIGYNGTPSGWDNCCEDENNNTKRETLHAEANALTKLARSNESGDKSIAFMTCAPCLDCAKLIVQTGIREIFYAEEYRGPEGIDFLKRCDIRITQLNITNEL